MRSIDEAVTAINRVEMTLSAGDNQQACSLVRQFVRGYQVSPDSPIVNMVLRKDWNGVSSFFSDVQADRNLNKYDSALSSTFRAYAMNCMAVKKPKSVNPVQARNELEWDEPSPLARKRGVSLLTMMKVVGCLLMLLAVVLGVVVSTKVLYSFLGYDKAAEQSCAAQLSEMRSTLSEIGTWKLETNTRLKTVESDTALLRTASSAAETARDDKFQRNLAIHDELATAVRVELQEKGKKVLESLHKDVKTLAKQVGATVAALGDAEHRSGRLWKRLESAENDTKILFEKVPNVIRQVDAVSSKADKMEQQVHAVTDELHKAGDRIDHANNIGFYTQLGTIVTVVIVCAWSICYIDHVKTKADASFPLRASDHMMARMLKVENDLKAMMDAAQSAAAVGCEDAPLQADGIPAGPGAAARGRGRGRRGT